MSKSLIINLFELSIKNISKQFDEEIKKIDELSQSIQNKSVKEEDELPKKISAYDKINELRFLLTDNIRKVQESCEDQLNKILNDLKEES